ncbi:hypothetical protein JS528_06445 [Bifidobacterium sp. MA2]|uniref:Lipoprotein n=1 Tax=Bifidobacterium santillanense TaxID=2809028 RepID=A0ABS5UQ30_9BIFI|nr:hypothetical protein [Bifidobacterium santillanense]MBT1173000.1 hypothetical protein [Bifidobacterium santillanense]
MTRNNGNGAETAVRPRGRGRKHVVPIAVAALLALAIAFAGCAGADAHRWLTGRAPLFALRSSRAIVGGTRTDYHGLWYRTSAIRFDDGGGYAHAEIGPGQIDDPPFDVRRALDVVTRELERRGLEDMSSRLDGGGYVTDCRTPVGNAPTGDDGASSDDGCAPVRVGDDPRSFSRVRILDWTRDGDVVHAYVYAFGEEFYRSLEGGRIVMDSGGESTWTADLDVSDGRTRLRALREAGGVSSMEIGDSDWPDLAQRMFLRMPHDGSAASNTSMRKSVERDAKAHYQGNDGRIYYLIDGRFMPADE